MNSNPCIFENNEIVIQQEIVAMKGYALSLSKWKGNKPFFAINPVKHIGDSRKSESVAVMKNFLFESDTMSIDQQKQMLKERIDVVSMATYSGNKSIHFIVQVEDAPETIPEYHYVWGLLKDKYFPCADTQCKDCIRLSRTPNAIRDNKKQQVLIINELKPLTLNWRPLYERIEGYRRLAFNWGKERPIQRNKKLTYEAEYVLSGDYPDGERDAIINKGVPSLFYNGYRLEEVLENNMESRNNPDTIRNYYTKLESGYYGEYENEYKRNYANVCHWQNNNK
jgi:hypothetical protein